MISPIPSAELIAVMETNVLLSAPPVTCKKLSMAAALPAIVVNGINAQAIPFAKTKLVPAIKI